MRPTSCWCPPGRDEPDHPNKTFRGAAESTPRGGILSSVGEGVYGVNTAGRNTFCNPAANAILGYAENDLLIGESAHAMFQYANADRTAVYPETCFLQRAYELGDQLLVELSRQLQARLGGDASP
jgi:PAS domain-containing protein